MLWSKLANAFQDSASEYQIGTAPTGPVVDDGYANAGYSSNSSEIEEPEEPLAGVDVSAAESELVFGMKINPTKFKNGKNIGMQDLTVT